jgi:NTP pyrophosphatase (non-canonical NTP hydrolase)
MKWQKKLIKNKMTDIETITKELIKFRDKRNWEKFHNSKDLALGLMIEAAELNQLFLWKNADEVDVKKLEEELADVFSFAFLLANKYKMNIKKIVLNKIQINSKKYPVKKSKNSAKKYNEI